MLPLAATGFRAVATCGAGPRALLDGVGEVGEHPHRFAVDLDNNFAESARRRIQAPYPGPIRG